MGDNVDKNQPTYRYVSQCDFEGATPQELSFKAGDRFQVLDQSGAGNWWLVERLRLDGSRTGEKGYVPYKFIAKEKKVEEQLWYLDVNGKEAEKLLLAAPNRIGSFLVRPSKSSVSGYALSVRRDGGVFHYLIQWDQELQFFTGIFTSFSCVHDLVFFLRKYWREEEGFRMVPYIKVDTIKDHWEKPLTDFNLYKRLNADDVSSLFEGEWIEKEKTVLIQSIDKETFMEEHFINGIDILKRLKHENIITLYALCTSEDPVYIVTAYLEKGDLQSFLRGEEGPFLTDTQLMHISGQVADGLAYLEVKLVAHCSLACQHIIVGNNLICKISYFEHSRMIKNSESFIIIHGSHLLNWMPPEYISNGELSTKTSVWSFGIILYEIFTLGQSPYTGLKPPDVLKKLESGYRLPMPPLCSPHVYRLMLKCWDERPSRRPSFQEIVERKIFQQ